MSTQTTMMDTQDLLTGTLSEAYDMRALADAEMDALLALEEAEIQNMEISEGADLVELKELLSENALGDLELLYGPEDWPLAS